MEGEDMASEEPRIKGSSDLQRLSLENHGSAELEKFNEQLMTEINQCKMAEETFRRSEEKFRLMVEHAHEGIFIASEGMFRFLNPRIVEIIGHPEEDLLSKPFTEFIYPEDREMVLQRHYRRIQGENIPSRYPFRMVDQEGHVTWVEIDSALTSWQGRPAVLGFMADVTERMHTEEALRQSEEKYRTIIENIEEGYYEVDIAGNHVFVNNSLCEILGYPRDELIGKNYRLFTEKKNPGRIYRTFNKVYTTGKPARASDWTIVHKDGTTRFVQVSASLIVNSDRQKIGFRGIMRDVTERRLIEEELKKHRCHLKRMVEERTAELKRTNYQLRLEIAERKKTQKALANSEKQLRLLSAQLLRAQEKERKRVAQELHDGIGQLLNAIKLRLEQTIGQAGDSMSEIQVKSLKVIIPVIQNAIEEVRRISMDLRPTTLDDLGILATISWFCREFQTTFSGIRVEKQLNLIEEEIPEPLKIVIFRVLQEALNNVGKHSNADFVRLCLEKKDGKIELAIQDDGVGFHRDAEFAAECDRRGFGLASMRERTELSGGSFAIKTSNETGTVVRCSWTEDTRKPNRE
jgi:PAS domain S-box-containing protein